MGLNFQGRVEEEHLKKEENNGEAARTTLADLLNEALVKSILQERQFLEIFSQ